MAPTSAATSGGIFGTAKGRPNPFAPATTSAAPVQSNPFAGLSSQPAATSNLFGKAAPAAQTSASPSSGGLFGRATTENQPGFLANNKDGVQPAPSAFGAPSVFGAPSKLRETSSPSTSALSAAPSLIQPSQQTQANNAPKTSNIFGSSNTASGSMAKTQPASATSSAVGAGLASSQTAQPSFVFPSAAASTGGQAQSGPSSSSTAGATASPFGALSTSAQSTSASATTVPAPSLFSTLGQFKPASAASAPAGTAATAANAASTSATPASVTNTQTGPASSTTATETSNVAASAPAAGGGVGASLFGTSTSGAAATPQSRLKNKSMEEIITTWAKDLSDYQKDFHRQADMVASWDQLLVENAEKIQKLYASTFEAERASSEVERQLSAVVGQQEELSGWLDRYEREVDEILAQQAGPGEGLQGPDQERERTYKLAEKLSDRLDVMGKDLKTMVEEINAASSSLSKTTKPDDPLSQIVKVLNSHLSSLQWIDQNAAALQAKVAAAQKTAQGTGSNRHRGLGEDAADDFYRSYLGRR
ncbi:MAG: FG-nucleoporin nsp1 [Phylliscum demangeonii]|nr:MAG: FG-nucleoporin nsp1 [Phylliscum demangeonii]